MACPSLKWLFLAAEMHEMKRKSVGNEIEMTLLLLLQLTESTTDVKL
jgi:hypothetical protein